MPGKCVQMLSSIFSASTMSKAVTPNGLTAIYKKNVQGEEESLESIAWTCMFTFCILLLLIHHSIQPVFFSDYKNASMVETLSPVSIADGD